MVKKYFKFLENTNPDEYLGNYLEELKNVTNEYEKIQLIDKYSNDVKRYNKHLIQEEIRVRIPRP